MRDLQLRSSANRYLHYHVLSSICICYIFSYKSSSNMLESDGEGEGSTSLVRHGTRIHVARFRQISTRLAQERIPRTSRSAHKKLHTFGLLPLGANVFIKICLQPCSCYFKFTFL